MFIFKYLEYIREFGLLNLLLDSFFILIFKNILLQKISNTYKIRKKSIINHHIPLIQLQQLSAYGQFCFIYTPTIGDFPGGAVAKNLPANARDMGSSPGPGRSHMPWSN